MYVRSIITSRETELLTGERALKADTSTLYVFFSTSLVIVLDDFNLYLSVILGSRGSRVLAVGINSNE